MKSGRERSLERVKRVVVVAIKASREISKTALEWALTHVVQPGDLVKLLVVIPVHSSSPNRWSLRRLNSDCTASKWRSLAGTFFDQKDMITDSCTEILIQLQGIYDSKKIRVKIDVVSESHCGAVAAEADTSQARWVVLDRRMKKEAKLCMEKLECNLVVMKKSGPKVLRLNLTGPSEPQTEVFSRTEVSANRDLMRVPNVTPASSPEHTTFTTTDVGTSSLSSLDLAMSPFSIPGINWDRKKDRFLQNERYHNHGESDSDTDSEKLSSSQRFNSFKYKSFVEKLSEPEGRDSSKNMREIISLTTNTPLDPPPLCSICRHKAPVFGKPPKWFTYAELERATDGFSKANFLAEGGYGSVHRGVLADGRVIAVKQHKLASSQGDNEFCSEVEVLSCAQHRNVVMLNGFCVEDKKRLLVYEYICNGSLDVHLYGRGKDPLDWSARQKIAIGAARGLRYLHEECRVGCIVHRDMRPNNILLTHDFEPLVGDFGLARWQPNGDLGVETRIIGTFGYMAPEYAQSGQVTEKADVYAFGVVLVELVTGRKAVDMNRPKGQQCLTEWARPLLEKNVVLKLVDPQLRNSYSEQEISTMIHCASLCLRRDPHSRPRMSQVLRTLEGDKFM